MGNCKWCGGKTNKPTNEFCSHACSNRWRYRNVQKEFVCQCCGKTYTKKNNGKTGRTYCSNACAIRSIGHRQKSAEHRAKIAAAQRLVRRVGDFYCERCGKHFTSNTSVRAHKARCGHVFPLFKCQKCQREFHGRQPLMLHQSSCFGGDWRKNCLAGAKLANIKRLQNGCRSSNTDIEQAVSAELLRRKIQFQPQFAPSDSWHAYDFYIPSLNLLLEADGDYWHGRAGQRKMPWHAKQEVFDRTVTRFAESRGFRIVRFWGSDIKADVSACIEEAIAYGESGQHRTDGRARSL